MARLSDEWAEEVTDVAARHLLADPSRRGPTAPRRHAGWSVCGSNLVIGTIAASVALGGVGAAVGVHLLGGDSPTASTDSDVTMRVAQQEPRSFSQQGTIVAINAESLTTRSPGDASVQTYRITPDTTAITTEGGQSASLDSLFAVHDTVAIVGTVRNGTIVATAVADLDAANLAGPPMDFVTTQQDSQSQQ